MGMVFGSGVLREHLFAICWQKLWRVIWSWESVATLVEPFVRRTGVFGFSCFVSVSFTQENHATRRVETFRCSHNACHRRDCTWCVLPHEFAVVESVASLERSMFRFVVCLLRNRSSSWRVLDGRSVCCFVVGMAFCSAHH